MQGDSREQSSHDVSMNGDSMPDRLDLSEFRPSNDHDLLVLLLAQMRQVNEGLRDLRSLYTDSNAKIETLSRLTDRQDGRISSLESSMTERKAQMGSLSESVDKSKVDLLGRMERLERDRLDPIETRISSVRNWIAGAVAVLVFLWIFLAPVYTRLLDQWFGRP